jgi:hypothetical protein
MEDSMLIEMIEANYNRADGSKLIELIEAN